MRSRVEIVARKSDHICVVRDVPDMRGSWYQRQQQSTQSNYSQHSSSGSLDHPVPPAAAVAAASATTATAGGQQQAATHKPLAGATGGAAAVAGVTQPAQQAPAKPSFAALFGKHPAIKEEPTTPGGTLTSETPPLSGPTTSIGAKRSPFKRSGLLSSGCDTTSSATPAPSAEQIGQIISLLNELKLDIKQDISQLSKRVDSMDASVSKVTQTVSRLDKHYIASLAPPDATSKSLAPPPKASSSTSHSGVRAHTSSASFQQPGPGSDQPQASQPAAKPVASDSVVRTTSSADRHGSSSGGGIGLSGSLKPSLGGTGSSITGITSDVKPLQASDAGSSIAPSSSSRERSRERSKSPHKHHHHHHHHHHHRKAQHSTPSATPTSSQLDLSKLKSAPTVQSASGATATAPSSSGVVELTSAALGKPSSRTSSKQHGVVVGGGDETIGSKRMSDRSSTTTKQSSMAGTQQRPAGSSEQSDDDQDATSKL